MPGKNHTILLYRTVRQRVEVKYSGFNGGTRALRPQTLKKKSSPKVGNPVVALPIGRENHRPLRGSRGRCCCCCLYNPTRFVLHPRIIPFRKKKMQQTMKPTDCLPITPPPPSPPALYFSPQAFCTFWFQRGCLSSDRNSGIFFF